MITWSPQPGPQTALVTCPVEDILYGGARGGGKTDGFLGKWLQRSTKYGGHSKGLFVRRSMPELDEVIARSHEIYLPIGALYRAQKSTWIMPNGALLRLRSLERDADAGKYQGHSYTDVYIDEAGNFPTPDPIDKLQATLRNPYGIPASFNLSANPGGPGHEWIKKRYIDAAPKGMQLICDANTGDERIYIPSRLEDNELLLSNDPQVHQPAEEVRATVAGSGMADGGLERHTGGRTHQGPLVPALQHATGGVFTHYSELGYRL